MESEGRYYVDAVCIIPGKEPQLYEGPSVEQFTVRDAAERVVPESGAAINGTGLNSFVNHDTGIFPIIHGLEAHATSLKLVPVGLGRDIERFHFFPRDTYSCIQSSTVAWFSLGWQAGHPAPLDAWRSFPM